jgi:antirestriction protein
MENPRIYVASLSDYNNGRLEGKWFDFDDYSDASELMDAITDMLDEITKKYNDGEEREEWAVHDYEYIPSTLATEYMGERDFQTIYDIIKASEEHGIPTEVLMERVGDTGSDDYRNIAESLMFVVDGNDESDIVYEMEEQFGELGFDFWQNHIYIDDVTQRVMYGEDVQRYREDIQYDNPDMDEDEVERLAEQQANDEENRRNDDLIGYLEEMEYTDIPTWVSKDYESAWKNEESYNYDIISYDGKMYVFSINYSQGGNVMYDNGGNVQRLSDEDVARIQQAIEQSRHKGIYEKYQENQISPKEAMEFVKENPEVLKLLVLKKGGKINSENYDMLRGKIKEVKHHASELQSITNRKKEVPAWVLAKSTRASTDLSDITHYMDSAKFGKGGNVSYKEQQINEVSSWDNDEIANYLGISISQVAKDRNRYVREAQSVLMLSSYGNGGLLMK